MRGLIYLLSFVLFLITIDGLSQSALIGFNVNQLNVIESSRYYRISDNTSLKKLRSFDADFTIGYQTEKYVLRTTLGFSTWSQNISYDWNFSLGKRIREWHDSRKKYKIGVGIERLFTYDKLHFYIGVNIPLIIDEGLRVYISDKSIFNNGDILLQDFMSASRRNYNLEFGFISRMYYEFLPNLSIGVHLIVALNYQFYDNQTYSSLAVYENQNLASESINNRQTKGNSFSQFASKISFGLQYQINWKRNKNINCSGLFK